jgi:hypothetical protein
MVCGDPDGVEFTELLNSPERPAEEWAGPQRHQVLQRDSLNTDTCIYVCYRGSKTGSRIKKREFGK